MFQLWARSGHDLNSARTALLGNDDAQPFPGHLRRGRLEFCPTSGATASWQTIATGEASLKIAASVSGLLLATGVMVADAAKDESEHAHAPPGGGREGMGM